MGVIGTVVTYCPRPEGIRHNCANNAHMVTGKPRLQLICCQFQEKYIPSVARNTMH